MKRMVGQTESLCPVCLRRIPAYKVEKEGGIYQEKNCPDHGNFMAIIWRQKARHYLEWAEGSDMGVASFRRLTEADKGCPYDCGLCPEHQTRACSMVMEVTLRCNLKCPVCFASSNENIEYEPDVDVIRDMYETVMAGVGICTIQLSGGEPTVRDDLPQIISLGREYGFEHILVNTNGVRIAKEIDYLKSLKDSGCSAIFLQFDGVTDNVYCHVRGVPLMDIKKQALDNCAKEQIGVILVPTLVRRVNDNQLGEIVRFAKSWIPAVKGVHIQPVSHLGRYPHPPRDEDRITIPDVINALESQTEGELKWQYFMPRHVKDAHCSFSSFFVLTEEGKLQSVGNLAREVVTGCGARKTNSQESAIRFLSRHWRFADTAQPERANSYFKLLTHNLTITCMPFQDVWTVDLDRLRGCCLHVVTPAKRIIPFCAYYLTGVEGNRLYPGRLSEESEKRHI